MQKFKKLFLFWLSVVIAKANICPAGPLQEQTNPASSTIENVAAEPAKALYLTASEFGIEGLPQAAVPRRGPAGGRIERQIHGVLRGIVNGGQVVAGIHPPRHQVSGHHSSAHG